MSEFAPWEDDSESPLKHLLYGSWWADARHAMHSAEHALNDPTAATDWEKIAESLKISKV